MANELGQEMIARVEKLRISKGFSTKTDLANAVGVTRQIVNNWYAQRTWPGPKEMLKLAEVLGTSVSYLYGEVTDPRRATDWNTGAGPQSDAEVRSQEAMALLRQAMDRLESGPA